MKILHELNQLEMGGAERVVAGIIRHDKENQHTVYSYKDGPMKSVLEEAGATVIIESKETIPVDCDIIHLHTGGGESTVAKCVKGQIVTVETIHSPVVSAVRDEWVSQRIGVSNQVTKMNRKCRTIYNGVDIDRLEAHNKSEKSLRETFKIPQDAFIIGRTGRIAHDKCLEEWLVACKKFQDMGICKEPHFLIVGDEADSSKGYLAKVKVMAASLPLRNVHFVPAMEHIGWAYEAMDVFMYPSPTEGFGLVYMEAMACGVATLLWDSDLTKELALGAAWLTKPTVHDLAETLAYLYLQPSIREQFALEGHQHVLNEFTEDRMSKRYQELYLELKGAPVAV
jgi:glycosyltransferase involved in cell wall biosynthesis